MAPGKKISYQNKYRKNAVSALFIHRHLTFRQHFMQQSGLKTSYNASVYEQITQPSVIGGFESRLLHKMLSKRQMPVLHQTG